MKLRLFLLLLFPMLFYSCSETDKVINDCIIPGKVENRIYSNIFFSLQIPEDWEIIDSNDRSQILAIGRIDIFDNPNIIFIATDSDEAAVFRGFKTRETEFLGFVNHQKSKSNVEITEGIKIVFIDGKKAELVRFLIMDKGREFDQYVFSIPVEGFYITVFATVNKNSSSDEVFKIVKSLKFR